MSLDNFPDRGILVILVLCTSASGVAHGLFFGSSYLFEQSFREFGSY